mgnify:CR=1 FL=1
MSRAEFVMERPAPGVAADLARLLFREEPTITYVVLDGASVPGLRQRLHKDAPESCCLYRGELAPDLAEVAPYLVRLQIGHPFTKWVLSEGWAEHWGIFVQTSADLRSLRRHFRNFLMVKNPEGKRLYFRFYDPRVLRLFLPTCDAQQLKVLFGPIDAYLCEADDPGQVLHWRLDGGTLKKQSLPLAPAGRART